MNHLLNPNTDPVKGVCLRLAGYSPYGFSHFRKAWLWHTHIRRVLQIEPVYANGHPLYRTSLRKSLASRQAAQVRIRPGIRLQAYYMRPHMGAHGTELTRPRWNASPGFN
jgi:hypothetical protein